MNKLSVVFAASTLLGLAACSQGGDPTYDLDGLSDYGVDFVNGEAVSCVDLLAGQTTDVGEVCWEVSGTNILITYNLAGGWELEEAHAWLGCDSSSFPQTRKGSPIPGQFPYNSGDITGATSFTFTYDISSLDCIDDVEGVCDDDVALSALAHAAVRKDNGDGSYQTETGWSTGPRILQKGMWATISTVNLHDDDCDVDTGDTGGPESCWSNETAYGFSEAGAYAYDDPATAKVEARDSSDLSTCFIDSGLADKWGWSSGPITSFPQSFTLYAGAGQCDRDKADVAGSATVAQNSDGSFTVTVSADSGVGLQTSHVWLGCDIAPLDNGDYTVAPGQLGSIVDGDGYTVGGSNSHEIADPGCTTGYYAQIHAETQIEVGCTDLAN